ncbi:MAG: stage II sporulation protein D [Clostridia bacterium]|nr:stage II sporulation protein D [Clostridia bacterium]MDD4047901.1 stage II sporulation protein D [Clostridia bacterium]
MSMRFIKRRQKRFPALLVGVFCFFFVIILLVWYFSYENDDVSIYEDKVRVSVLNHETRQLMELGLEEYVVGVVAAEMPTSFPLEALKAQAVAARTYAVKRLQIPDPRVKEKNKEADLSTDHNINQAWISTDEMKKRWGKWNYKSYREKIVQAVEETKGKVLVYNEQLIDPVYHASCGGKGTDDSEDVWKFDVPYLRGVKCTGHEDSHNAVIKFIKFEDFDSGLSTNISTLAVSKMQGGNKILNIKGKTKSGRVKSVMINGKEISGAKLRTCLQLKSTRFAWKIVNGGIQFETNGYGHGVGMCQYGAADLARNGKGYADILKHYYTGVKIAVIKVSYE